MKILSPILVTMSLLAVTQTSFAGRWFYNPTKWGGYLNADYRHAISLEKWCQLEHGFDFGRIIETDFRSRAAWSYWRDGQWHHKPDGDNLTVVSILECEYNSADFRDPQRQGGMLIADPTYQQTIDRWCFEEGFRSGWVIDSRYANGMSWAYWDDGIWRVSRDIRGFDHVATLRCYGRR